MLEGVAVELCVVIEIIWIRKEVATRTKNVAATHIGTWQAHLLGFGYLEAVLGLAVE